MSTTARRALGWSFAERYAGLLVAIASTMILSRLLTPAQVGIYSLCAAFVAVAGILRDFGVSEYIIQERELTPSRLRSAYGLAFAVAWPLGALIYLAREGVAAFYGEPQVADVLAVLSLHFFILPISSPTFALLNRELAFRQIFLLQLVSNSAQAVASVAMAYAGWGVMSLAWGPIVNVGVQCVVLFALRPKDCLILPAFSAIKHVLRFGLMFVSSRTVEVLTRNFHDPVLAKQFDFAAVGLFSRAFGLIELFHSNIGAAVIRVATPAFAAQHRAGGDIAPNYAKAMAIFSCVSWAFFAFIALMAEPIIRLMFGAQWVAAAPLAAALALSAMPHGLYALAPQMLSSTGHVAKRLRITLFCSPIHMGLVLLAAQHSLHAVAWTWAISNSIILGCYLYQIRQTLGVSLSFLLRPSVRSLIVVAVSSAVQFVALFVLRRWTDVALLQIVGVFLVGAIVWFGAARFVSHPVYQEIAALARALRSRVLGRKSLSQATNPLSK